MKTCPEKDKILLFCERGLSEVEQAEFELHLKSCAVCRKELEQIRADDALLRQGVEEAFARHRVSNRIMQQIRSENVTPTTISKISSHILPYFWSIALALLVILVALSLFTPTAVKYHGRAQGVMIQTLNESSTLKGEHLNIDQAFKLETPEPIALDGCFLFTVTNGHTSVFKMSGRAKARLSDELPEFLDSDAKFELVSGARLTIKVNQKPLLLERKKLSATAPTDNSDLQQENVSAVNLNTPLIRTATTTDEQNAILEGEEEAALIKLPENASATCATEAEEETTGNEDWVDPTQTPMKSPFADEPIEINGN